MEQKYRYKDRVQENWKTSTVTREQQGELYDRIRSGNQDGTTGGVFSHNQMGFNC